MPYINSRARSLFADIREILEEVPFSSPGYLNYALTIVIQEYISQNELSYQTINDIIGALEGCKMEFYRRVASKYEDEKIEKNGDVY